MKPYNVNTASGGHEDSGTDLMVAEPKIQVKKPPLFKVVLLNDDFTPMEFVVQVLREVFHKSEAESVSIMLEVHTKGAGICGVYTRDVAETKAEIVVAIARKQEYPLQCLVEQE